MNRFYQYAAFAFFVLATISWGQSVSPRKLDDIRIVTCTSSGFVIEIDVPEPTQHVSTPQNTSGVQLTIDGYSSSAEPGKPMLPIRAIPFGLPPGAVASVKVVHIDVTSESVSEIVPAPTYKRQNAVDMPDEPMELVYEKDDTVYRSNRFYPEEHLLLGSRGCMRNLNVQSIIFYPIRYNAATREIERVKHIRLAVFFTSDQHNFVSTSAHDNHAYNSLFSNTLLNYQQAKSWALRRRPLAKANAYFMQQGQEWLKIFTDQSGLYSLSGADISQAGLELENIDPQLLKIYHLGEEIAIRLVGDNDGRFDPTDSIEFFAQPFKNEFTTTNVYWLTIGTTPGKRMLEINGAATGTAPTLSFGHDVLHHEIDYFHVANFPGHTNQEHWFMDSLFAPATRRYQFNAGHIARDSHEQPYFVVRMQGFAANINIQPDHHTVALLNGEPIYEKWWDGRIAITDSVTFNQSSLKDGLNELEIIGPGDTGNFIDWQLIDYFKLGFSKLNSAANDSLSFRATQNGRFTVQASNFSSKVSVYDISTPQNPAVITGLTKVDETVEFEVNVNQDSRFLLVSDATKNRCRLEKDEPSAWRDTAHGADYLIIVYDDFYPDVSPLASFHESNGYSVHVVKVQDIYDEFGYGIYDKTPIKKFLAYAYTNWAVPPTFVLFVGDASWNPRRLRPELQAYGSGLRTNFIPTHLFEADVDNAQATSDTWFACFDGEDDVLPDMMIGRLPARSKRDVNNMVRKILNYATIFEQGTWQKTATFVADIGEGGFNAFEALSDSYIVSYIPDDFTANRIYLSSLGMPQTKNKVFSAFGQGCLTLNYFGHGAVRLWAKDGIFTTTDIPSLDENVNVPFVFTMSCINGYFADPNSAVVSLGEQLVLEKDRGAIAVFTGSGKAFASILQPLARTLYRTLYTETKPYVGAFTNAGLLGMFASHPFNTDHVRFYVLFGDPATRLHYTNAGPSSRYAWYSGTVDFHGSTPPQHSLIRAFIDGHAYSSGFVQNDSAAFGPLYIPADNPETLEKDGGATGDSVYFTITPPNDSAYVLKPFVPWRLGQNSHLLLYRQAERVNDFAVDFFVDHNKVGESFFDGDPIRSTSLIYADAKVDKHATTTDIECFLNNAQITNSGLLQISPVNPATRRVTISFSPQYLTDGEYEFIIRINPANGLSQTSSSFRFSIRSHLSLDRVVNFPNPFAESTKFTFMLMNDRAADVSIKIYTVAGRLIQKIDSYADVGYNELEWDGRDAYGDAVANGVYFYKISADDGEEHAETIERLVIMR